MAQAQDPHPHDNQVRMVPVLVRRRVVFVPASAGTVGDKVRAALARRRAQHTDSKGGRDAGQGGGELQG